MFDFLTRTQFQNMSISFCKLRPLWLIFGFVVVCGIAAMIGITLRYREFIRHQNDRGALRNIYNALAKYNEVNCEFPRDTKSVSNGLISWRQIVLDFCITPANASTDEKGRILFERGGCAIFAVKTKSDPWNVSGNARYSELRDRFGNPPIIVCLRSGCGRWTDCTDIQCADGILQLLDINGKMVRTVAGSDVLTVLWLDGTIDQETAANVASKCNSHNDDKSQTGLTVP